VLVNICGALMILNAVAGLFQVLVAPFFSEGNGIFAPRVQTGLVIFYLAEGLAGYGLRVRNRLARWWTLGPFMIAPLFMLLAVYQASPRRRPIRVAWSNAASRLAA
jgi:hypothetical protein